MEKGVRQGCSVSPMLYSLFTAGLLSELSTRTSDTWIQRLVTCFADDTHLAWTIEQPSDLDFVCRSLRATFQLLRECNMVVNSDKSSVVIGLKGSQAKRWIRRHTVAKAGCKCIDFGVPGDPLCIPMVESFVYLGIVVTYKQFELLSLQHRVKTASANRARLNKLLHSKQLALRRRVSLYLSCVRSTLLFGLHVVGLTDATLKKLEAVDAKHLRSIARSPVHLTRESNHVLRTRLGVRSPARELHSLLQRRVRLHSDEQFCGSLRTLSDWLNQRLTHLESMSGPGHGTLQPCLPTEGVACPVCGIYFDCMRTMHSHMACKHGSKTERKPMPKSQAYTAHTRDGMPQCKHCNSIFTRVEALKNHLRGSCPVLHASTSSPPHPTEDVGAQPPLVASGATVDAEPLGH